METRETPQDRKLVPLFPLGVVMLPRMMLKLHIFEERYKIMINECVDRGGAFGIVYFDGTRLKRIGCTASVIKLLSRYPDGRMDIMTQGGERFYIEEIDESRAYLQARVTYVEDADEAKEGEITALGREALKALKAFDRVSGIIRDYDRLSGKDPRGLSFLIPASEGFTLEERQAFLEMTSTRERLTKGMEALKRVTERTKINRELKEVIGANGHARTFLAERGLMVHRTPEDSH